MTFIIVLEELTVQAFSYHKVLVLNLLKVIARISSVQFTPSISPRRYSFESVSKTRSLAYILQFGRSIRTWNCQHSDVDIRVVNNKVLVLSGFGATHVLE